MSAIYSIKNQREGTSLKKSFTYTDSDGNAIDLSSYGARLIIKRNYESETADLDISEADYISLDANGNIVIEVPDVEMTVAAGNYIYILYLDDPVNGLEDFLSGEFIVKQGLI